MSKYYKGKRTKNIYDPSAKELFKLSRSKIDDFLKCPRCFYIDRRLGIAHPPGYPFSLNVAVDMLLKKEFDAYRAKGTPHPIMKAYGLNAVPFSHEKLDEWRDSTHKGITYHFPGTNLLITGGVDDVWTTQNGELIIVDYKATSKAEEVTLDAEWQEGYKRQMEVYQWLFRRNGFKVFPTGYFVYCNGVTDKDVFDNRFEFNIKLIPYKGDDSWVERTIKDLYKTLKGNKMPKEGKDCDYCKYIQTIKIVFENS